MFCRQALTLALCGIHFLSSLNAQEPEQTSSSTDSFVTELNDYVMERSIAIDALFEAATKDDGHISHSAVVAFYRIDLADAEVSDERLSKLIEHVLRSAKKSVRDIGWKLLRKQKWNRREKALLLFEILRSTEGAAQSHCLHRLNSYGSEAVDLIIPVLSSQDESLDNKIALLPAVELIDECWQQAVPVTLQLFAVAGNKQKLRLMQTWQRMGNRAMSALSVATAAIDSEDDSLKLAAIESVGAMLNSATRSTSNPRINSIVDALFKRSDLSKDGVIDEEELAKLGGRFPPNFDVDQDGQITREEMTQVLGNRIRPR